MQNEDDLQATARIALSCLDLTSLNETDTVADIQRLCERAQGPCGPVAAVCVWPRFAADARGLLPAHIAVAAVANFPDGSADIARAVRDTVAIVAGGAQEIDVVLPIATMLARDEAHVMGLLAEVRAACPTHQLKVILETGVLGSDDLIRRASEISIAAGADWLKTSTGKTAVSATPGAARTMLDCIAEAARHGRVVGFKASGGIRTVADASVYLRLYQQLLARGPADPHHFRLGASSLLDDIETVLGRTVVREARNARNNGY
ncbi:deoxyribose-phosphate aldolase [Paraburkholderia xenovorans]|uniref:deoxyribose-phosphate aldolase n=1 Tax=Paraburkholderia xenovorans TaxID=36873 RepID=UPI0038BCE27A